MLRNTLLPLLQELYLNLQNRTDNNILLTNVGEIMIYNLLTEQTILNLFNQCYISERNNICLKLFMETLYVQYPEFKQNIEKHLEIVTSLKQMDLAFTGTYASASASTFSCTSLSDQLNLIGASSSMIYNLLKDRYINSILDKKQVYKYGFIIDYVQNLPLLIWSEIISQIFHSRGCNMITIKNMKQLYQFIQAGKNGFCKLSNKHMVTFYNNALVFVDIRLVSDSNVWTISTSLTDEKVSSSIDIADFLSGHFTINIPVCEHSYDVNKISYTRHIVLLKKIFKGLIYKFVPNIHIKNNCSTCDIYTLTLSYNIF
jgi:hypothetical protein